MDVDVKINQLSDAFLRDYPAADYPELMYKKGRPYSCLLIDLHLEYRICIPKTMHGNISILRFRISTISWDFKAGPLRRSFFIAQAPSKLSPSAGSSAAVAAAGAGVEVRGTPR